MNSRRSLRLLDRHCRLAHPRTASAAEASSLRPRARLFPPTSLPSAPPCRCRAPIAAVAVSHKDFADQTVKADGLDFELVHPRRSRACSPCRRRPTITSNDGSPTQSPSTPAGHLRVINGSPSSAFTGVAATIRVGRSFELDAQAREHPEKQPVRLVRCQREQCGHLADTDSGILED